MIHAGVYYAPDSLKADFCRRGVQATIDFCQQHNIAYEQCGKLLVATTPTEEERMQALFTRGQENGLDLVLLNAAELKAKEPNIVGLGAIYAKTTGIVNYQHVSIAMAKEFASLGGETRLNTLVTDLQETADCVQVTIKHNAQQQTLSSKFLITCSGLMADRVTKMLGIKTDFQIIPFWGEYYRLPAKYNNIVNSLIYPIPDPELPFLGGHLTKMIDGSVTVGPNAVQGWKRVGYGKININLRDIGDMIRFQGFWKVLSQHFRTGLIETFNSWYKLGYLKLVQKYCPQLTIADLEPFPAGVRAQAVLKDGTLVHDFLFAHSPRSLHVCNAPSPAATSSIPIGQYIIEKVMVASTQATNAGQ